MCSIQRLNRESAESEPIRMTTSASAPAEAAQMATGNGYANAPAGTAAGPAPPPANKRIIAIRPPHTRG